MLFNSIEYLFFLPFVSIIFYLLNPKYRNIWLLGVSLFFYMNWNPIYVILMIFSITTTYYMAVLIESKEKYKKIWLFLTIITNLSILFFFKYYNFFIENILFITKRLGMEVAIPTLNFLLPVGISFYTFQALGYTVDVYRKKIEPEKNLKKYALFVSFFPQLVAGPIERSTHLLPQFNKKIKFNIEKIREGVILILFGLMKKMIIADRIAVIVDNVYNNVEKFTGYSLIIASFCFAVQIYCDFSSYSSIAIGSAKILGYDLMENFNKPYFSSSIREFWKKWHISLGLWFKDYLYIPLGGSKNKEIKTIRNIFITFLISGIWHGANWNFIIWGLLHGFYQIIEMKLKFIGKYFDNYKVFKYSKIVITFILIDFAWIFFRAKTFYDAKYIILNLFNFSGLTLKKELYTLGLDKKDLKVAGIAILLLFILEISKINKEIIFKQNIVIRWFIYFVLIFSILIFGYYGEDISSAQFIYFQF